MGRQSGAERWAPASGAALLIVSAYPSFAAARMGEKLDPATLRPRWLGATAGVIAVVCLTPLSYLGIAAFTVWTAPLSGSVQTARKPIATSTGLASAR